jgi:hypothetical protein
VQFQSILRRTVAIGSIRWICLVLFAFLALTITSPSGWAQVSDAATRFGNVSGWKGMLTFSGHGTGTNPVGCAGGEDRYSNNQSVTSAPELQGQFPDWTGPSNSEITLAMTDLETCPEPFPSTCFQTITGIGGLFLIDIFTLDIDANQGTYQIQMAPAAVIAKGCDGSTTNGGWPLGPLYGPGGAFIGGTFAGQNPLPAKGVNLTLKIATAPDKPSLFAVPWEVSWRFAPVCRVKIPKTWGQGDKEWSGQDYDRYPGQTIGSKGCALTSLAMALAFAGVETLPDGSALNPGSLDTFLSNSTELTNLTVAWLDSHGFSGIDTGITENGFTNAHGVKWDSDTRYATDFANLKFKTFGKFRDSVSDPQGAHELLDEALCNATPHPVIVGVKLACFNKAGGSVALAGESCPADFPMGPTPGHYVLVTGKDGDRYEIADPATGSMRSLNDDYGNKFQTRGSVVDPNGDISSLNITSDHNVSLLVTDSLNNRTGEDPSSGAVVQQIPGSAYFIDRITDGDIDGINSAGEPEPTTHAVQIFQPSQGVYSLIVKGVAEGPYTISIDAFSNNGGPQPPISLEGTIAQGATRTYSFVYNPAPGSVVTVISLLGDRNGDGVVDCKDLAIIRASFGKKTGQSGFDPRADVNGDGIVNILDLSAVARQIPAGTKCQ